MDNVFGDLASARDEGTAVATGPGLFTIQFDERRRLILINDLAVQNLADVDRYLAALTEIIARVRRRDGQVRILADLRRSPVRTQEAAERLRLGNVALYREGDRVALLVDSSLLKMQLRRNLVAEYQNIFLSQDAAETWLTAFDPAPHATQVAGAALQHIDVPKS